MSSVLLTTQNTRSERVCGLPGLCVYGCGLPFTNQMSVGKPVTLNLVASARPPAVESASTFAITALLPSEASCDAAAANSEASALQKLHHGA